MSTQSILQFCDSCQHYSSAQAMRKWTLNSGSVTVLPTGGRRGLGAVAVGFKLGWTFPAESYGMASAAAGGAFFPTSGLPVDLISFSSAPLSLYASPELLLRLNVSGIPEITINGTTVATGTYVVTVGAFYFYEFSFQLVQVLIGSLLYYVWNVGAWITSGADPSTRTQVLAASALTNAVPAAIAHTSPNEGMLPSGVPNVFYLHGAGNWCDIWLTGSSASPMTDQGGGLWYDPPNLLGDQRVDAVRRVSDVSAGATPSTAGPHYAMVNEATPDDFTNTLAYPTVGDQDLGLFGPFAGGSIAGVQFISGVAKDTAGPAAFKQVWSVSGTDYTDGKIYAPSANSWPYVLAPRDLDIVSGVPYTPAILRATAFGIERTA